MNKKIAVVFLMTLLFVCRYANGQNPYYAVTQENVRPTYSNNIEVLNNVFDGNTYDSIYPAYTTFLIDGYVLENIPSFKQIQGLPIGFKFPYAGEEFDIYALNAKGYIVFGKSWEGGMTVFADTLIETATDTVFTEKNKYLISGLYAGKDMDRQGSVSVQIYKGGFIGERKLYISVLNRRILNNGAIMYFYNDYEIKETGEINIKPYIQILNNTNNNNIHSYATFIQRYGMGKNQYVFGTGNNVNTWFQTEQSYNTNYKYGILTNNIFPSPINQQTYVINYQPIASNFTCAIPIRWYPNPPRPYADSAYLPNDHQYLQGDTIETSDKVWWFSDMRDSLRFDVYLGTDEVSMELYKAGLVSDTFEVYTFNFITGMVKLSLDSLAAGQHYFMRIQSIHPSGDTTVCDAVSFYTKSREANKNYCRSDEYIFNPVNDAFSTCFVDLNTLHFHLTSDQIVNELAFKTLVPDIGSWTTTLQQGQSYTLQLSCPKWNYQPATSFMVSVFMDYNQDGIFDHPDNNNDNHTFGISDTVYRPLIFSIPKDAVLGKTRLRIAVRYNDNVSPFPGACEEGLGSQATTYVNFEDFTITITQAPSCNLSYNDTIVSPSCATQNDGGLTIIPEGGTEPFRIQWNTGNPKDTLFTLSGLASPARHRATITDAAGCNIRTSMLQLTQPASLRIDTMLHSNPSWIAFSGGTKPYQAAITGDKAETRYAVNDTVFLTDLPAGNYNIKAMDSKGCDEKFSVSHSTDPDPLQPNDFILYPNPTTQYIQIAGINNSAFIIIYSSDGKKVFEGNCTNQHIIQLPGLASALYLVRITEDERNKTIKLIIK